jgi:hypothetical protein
LESQQRKSSRQNKDRPHVVHCRLVARCEPNTTAAVKWDKTLAQKGSFLRTRYGRWTTKKRREPQKARGCSSLAFSSVMSDCEADPANPEE